MTSQYIMVVLTLKEGQEPYDPIELKGGGKEYPALRHFFEDIGYKVEAIQHTSMRSLGD